MNSENNKEEASNQDVPRGAAVGDAVGARDADFSVLEAEEAKKPEAGPSPEVIKLKAEVEEQKDKYLRALAELENYKKRALKERSELIKYQGEAILGDLLEVIDNLEWALSHKETDPDKLKAGLELIHKLFVDVLGRWDIRAIAAVGTEFDPSRHQALSRVPTKDSKPGTVLSELKKAYMYKDKLLRPGTVVVAAALEEAKPDSVSSECSKPQSEQPSKGNSEE